MIAIVIVATIFLGVRLLGGVTSASCGASDARFIQDLERAFDSYSQFGSRGTVDLNPPCGTQELCFVDIVEIGRTDFQSDKGTITYSVQNGVQSNIFLVKDAGVLDVGYDERIVVTRSPQDEPSGNLVLCTPVRTGKLSFTAEGFGRYVRVAE